MDLEERFAANSKRHAWSSKMRFDYMIAVILSSLPSAVCNPHDPEGLPQSCCPIRAHIDVAKAGGEDTRERSAFNCGFGPAYYATDPKMFGASMKFYHGIEELSDECEKTIGELGYTGWELKRLLSRCQRGYARCGVSLASSVSPGAEPLLECSGQIPLFMRHEAERYGIARFEMTFDDGWVSVSKTYPEDGRNQAFFHFRLKPDPGYRAVVEKFHAEDYIVELAGSCECEPYIAPPETDCEAAEYN